jgi:hypothetical protein
MIQIDPETASFIPILVIHYARHVYILKGCIKIGTGRIVRNGKYVGFKNTRIEKQV